jgi:NAD+--dinitrogen-reductase ADP-D-ribosyltransferase
MKPASLPAYARRSINRCNLPAIILGSLTFQQYPTPLFIDGVWELHGALFRSLEFVSDPAQRAIQFMDYMRSSFLLDNLDDAGFAGAVRNVMMPICCSII